MTLNGAWYLWKHNKTNITIMAPRFNDKSRYQIYRIYAFIHFNTPHEVPTFFKVKSI